ncbi:hypothetical protein BDN72DRAFT_905130 [Pluteus cervinus]|uniref:Uncharacterized protein n=1 Tax=Pluteus cervinus TaxID=181527 RepID=A0ACD3A3M7_9AGAR|nr:hypothetical protein BDN72DRAFT_905130 [Pluteus cervinus]
MAFKLKPGESARTRMTSVLIDWDDLPTRFSIPQPPSSFAPSTAGSVASYARAPSSSRGSTIFSSSTTTVESMSRLSSLEQDSVRHASTRTSGPSRYFIGGNNDNSDGAQLGDPNANASQFSGHGNTGTPAPKSLPRKQRKYYNAEGVTYWFEITIDDNADTVPQPGAYQLDGLCDNDLFVVRKASDPEGAYQIHIFKRNKWSPIALLDELELDTVDASAQQPGKSLRPRVLVLTKEGGYPSWVLKDTALKNYNNDRRSRAQVDHSDS